MSTADLGRHVVTVVRPGGAASPPGGFLCEALAKMVQHAATSSGHARAAAASAATAPAVVSPGGFLPLVYRGRAAEGHFPRDVPTCSRFLVANPSNALTWHMANSTPS